MSAVQSVIVSVGDTMLGDGAAETIARHGWAYPFERVRPLLERGDLLIGNLEAPITDVVAIDDCQIRRWRYGQDPRVAETYAKLGFQVFNLANNHLMDQGPQGLFDTLAHLSRAGIRHFGAGADATTARRGAVVEVNGLRIGFLGVTRTYRVLEAVGAYAAADRPGVAQWSAVDTHDEIQRLKRESDLVFANVHWGRNYRPLQNHQTRQGRNLVRWGAQVVNGHHPHVIHGVELVNGVPLLYSLGNFVFGSPGRFAHFGVPGYGLIATYILEGPRLTRVELDVIVTDNARVHYRPFPASEREARLVLEPQLVSLRTPVEWVEERAIISVT